MAAVLTIDYGERVYSIETTCKVSMQAMDGNLPDADILLGMDVIGLGDFANIQTYRNK